MTGFLSYIFGSAHDAAPLPERDVIEIGSNGWFDRDYSTPEGSDARVINFQSILETGEIPVQTSRWAKDPVWGDQSIDWDSDDAFTRAIERVKNAAFERIQNSPGLQNLLAKENWDRGDRVSWEREVSTIVSQELDRIPGLDEPRIFSDGGTAETRATRLNDLSADIENGTATIEFDCEAMSVVEGVILQQADNRFLPETSPEGDFKVGSNYFFAAGSVNRGLGAAMGGHAFIISSATGNIIEAVVGSGDSYYENENPDYSFEAFVRGEMAFSKNGVVYGGYDTTIGDVAALRIERGQVNIGNLYDRIDPSWVNHQDAAAPEGEETLQRIPPELESLVELKGRVKELEELLEKLGERPFSPATSAEADITRARIDHFRTRFDNQVDELIENGGIYNAVEFIEFLEEAAFLEENPLTENATKDTPGAAESHQDAAVINQPPPQP